MLSVDQYGKNLSSDFNTAIAAKAQKIKPKVVVTWLDSRHLDNLVVTTNSQHANLSYPNLGFYFSQSQAVNGVERQSYTWGVAGAKDVNGDVIKADGTWHTMPSLITSDLSNSRLDGTLEFGWWSASQSNSSDSNQYTGYGFATEPFVDIAFTTRFVNKIRVITSEYYGQIANYTMIAFDSSSNVISAQDGLMPTDSYYVDHIISENLPSQNIARIRVTVHSTRNPVDHARIQEIVPIYEEDMSDYVISVSTNRARDIHETSLPIGGSETSSASVDFDNTTKKFNVFDNNSDFGKYMKKDLKVEIYSGWRIKKPSDDYLDNVFIDTFLTANANSSTTTLQVNDLSVFPSGGAGNDFTVILDRGNQSQEIVLCSGTTSPNILNVISRGFSGTSPVSHSVNALVDFEIYEYVPNGTFYLDEWSSDTSGMVVGASMQDWTKYLNEKSIKYGFLEQNAFVGKAVEMLLMRANFPRADIYKLNKYTQGAILRGAIAGYSFKEETIDRSGNNIVPSNGLRARFWGMPSNKRDITVKDIVADALDRELSSLDLALGQTKFLSPSFVALSKNISTSSSNAIQVVNFQFTGNDSTVYTDFFNGVFDGYYIPRQTGNQKIIVNIASGGVRVYLDDAEILNEWITKESNTRIESLTVNLTAGVPRKIRVEFFHAANNGPSPSFSISLSKNLGANDVLITADECTTIAPLDFIGVREGSRVLSDVDAYHMRNNGVYINTPKLSQTSGLVSDVNNASVLLESSAYIRIPFHQSINVTDTNANLYTGKWSMEFYGKFSNGSFNNDGEYISNWANSTPTSGFEFFNASGTNGFRIKTLANSSVITETVSSNTALSNSTFTHAIVTFDGSKVYYYVNGDLKANAVLTGTPVAFANDITIGGRGASYLANSGEVAPTVTRSFIIDEFYIYNEHLDDEDVDERYSESQIQPLTNFAFLYGNDQTIKEIINDITFAELGRLYIDETNQAKYEHFFRFFEPSIYQHADIQETISDSTFIVGASFAVQLQCNKVTIPLSGLSTSSGRRQQIWSADDDVTLATVALSSNLASNANVVFFSSSTDIPFPPSGHIKIGSEIIKYNSRTGNSFANLERGQFQTTAAAHIINNNNASKIREVKYYNITFEKAPAFNIQDPFITAIRVDEPDLIEIHKYLSYPYGAELIVATANTAPIGKVVFLSGIDRETSYPNATTIAGVPVIVSENKSDIKSQTASVEDSIKKFGLKDVTVESNFINDAVHAQKLANFIITKTQIPVPILVITTIIMPKVQLGDRIRISNLTALGIVNTDYWVISCSRAISSGFSQQMTLRQVS